MALDTHTQTLQALESFIASQRLLIARQRDDIERLQTLKRDVSENCSAVLGNLSDELCHTAFHLSTQADLRLALPNGISWSVFDKADTTPLHSLASQLRQKHTSRSTPSKCQQSCLSELQVLVKKARKEIIDPVLEWVAKSTTTLMSDSDDEGDEQTIDPLERKRYEEKVKIMELKKRKIKGSGSGLSLLTTRNVVFVRDDMEDETHDVDVGAWGDDLNDRQREKRDKTDSQTQTTLPSHCGPTGTRTKKANRAAAKDRPQLPTKNSPDGDERPRKKVKIILPSKRVQSTAKRKSPIPHRNGSATPEASSDEAFGGSPKPRSDTYKQAWSMEEQHLLERLLEEIPDGEKNRWLRISQAMGGRRTPRQVASRVQKYFEKLKKFGVAAG